jgi:hypothetical protein
MRDFRSKPANRDDFSDHAIAALTVGFGADSR